MRRIGNGLKLIIEELLAKAAGRVAQHATGCGDFDDIGTRLDLFAHGAATIIDAVAHAFRTQHMHDIFAKAMHIGMPTGGAECCPCCENTWAHQTA